MPQFSGEHTELLKNQFDENACVVSEIKTFHTQSPSINKYKKNKPGTLKETSFQCK